MGWTLKKKQTRVTTRKHAEELANMEGCPQDRAIKPFLLAHLNSQLIEGQFRPPSWAIINCKEDGKVYRVNGKHSSTVLALANGHFPKSLPHDFEEYDGDTREDVAKLYATFDRRESARHTGDINRVYAAANPKLVGVPGSIVNLAVTGIGTATWANYYSVKVDARAAKLLEFPDFVLWLQKILQPDQDGVKSVKHIRRGPVVGAMFATWGKSRVAAAEFWRLVREGCGEDHRTADRKLNAYLLSTSLSSSTGGGRATGVASREMYVKCLHAWNAWRRGESTDMKYYPAADVPPVK